MVERGGRVHLQRVENAKVETLRPVIAANLSPDASKVVTDDAAQYKFILPKEKHESTVHEQELNMLGKIEGTKTVEGAFSLFKRGVFSSDQRTVVMVKNR